MQSRKVGVLINLLWIRQLRPSVCWGWEARMPESPVGGKGTGAFPRPLL